MQTLPRRTCRKVGARPVLSLQFLFGLALALVLVAAPATSVWAEDHGDTHGTGVAEAGGHGEAGAHGGGHHGTTHLDNWFSLSYGEGKEHKNGPLGFALLNFALLIYLLVRFTKKPLRHFLVSRHAQVQKNLVEAAELRDAAKAKLEEINGKLEKFEQEVTQLKEDVRKDAEKERDRIIKAAHAEAERLVKQADKTLDQELRRARAMLEAELVEVSLSLAEERIRGAINDADRKRINDEYISRIASSGGAN